MPKSPLARANCFFKNSKHFFASARFLGLLEPPLKLSLYITPGKKDKKKGKKKRKKEPKRSYNTSFEKDRDFIPAVNGRDFSVYLKRERGVEFPI